MGSEKVPHGPYQCLLTDEQLLNFAKCLRKYFYNFGTEVRILWQEDGIHVTAMIPTKPGEEPYYPHEPKNPCCICGRLLPMNFETLFVGTTLENSKIACLAHEGPEVSEYLQKLREAGE